MYYKNDKNGIQVQVEIAFGKEDMTTVHGLRYDAYCRELKTENADLFPEREERDVYDTYATHIIVREKDEIIATLRLIRDNPNGFLMERFFKLPAIIDRSKTLEHSREVVRIDKRGRGIHDILTEAGEIWHKENGYMIGIGAGVDLVSRSLLKKGWQVFGEPVILHGVRLTPIMFYLE